MSCCVRRAAATAPVPALALLALLGAAGGAAGEGAKAEEVTALAWTPGGRALIWASHDGHLRESDPATGRKRREVLAHEGGVFGLDLSADGKLLATAGTDRLVRLWDTARLKEVGVLRGHTDCVAGVAVSPDGKWLASGGYDGDVRLWDAVTGKPRHQLKGHEHRVTSLAFSPDGKGLVSGGIVKVSLPGVSGLTRGDQLRLWDVETGVLRRHLPLTGHRVAFSPDGTTLAASGHFLERASGPSGVRIGGIPVANGTRVGLLDWRGQSERLLIQDHNTAIAFSADGKLLATGWGSYLHYGGLSTSAGVNRGIHVWETATGKEALRVEVPRGEATALAFSPDGRRIASGTSRGSVKLHPLTPPGWSAPAKLDAAALEGCWERLAGADAAAAYRAIWDLSACGDEAVTQLARRLKPAPAVAPARLRQLLADLDGDEFATRERAQKELAGHGGTVEGDLERLLAGSPSPEVRRRVRALLAPLGHPGSEDAVRAGRAVMALERIGTPAARKALRALAGGAAGARLTRDAQGALKRLALASATPP